MIIKNNFNNKSVNPLDDYESVGKTRDNNIDGENININRENKEIIDDILRSDHEFDELEGEEKDKWDFFR